MHTKTERQEREIQWERDRQTKTESKAEKMNQRDGQPD